MADLPAITGTAEQWKELYYKEQAELTALHNLIHIERRADGDWVALHEDNKMDFWMRITPGQLPWFNALRNLLRAK